MHGISIDRNLTQISGVDPARVAVIKLDIQGHEYEALAGAIATIRTALPVLYFEFSPTFTVYFFSFSNPKKT